MSVIPISYGDVVLVGLDPALGSEQRKTRPAVVVSNNALNRASPICIIVPITSKSRAPSPTQVVIRRSSVNGLRVDSRVLCEQIRSIDKQRLQARWGRLTPTELRELQRAILVTLNQF